MELLSGLVFKDEVFVQRVLESISVPTSDLPLDGCSPGFEFEEPYVEEAEQPLRIEQDSKLRLSHKEHNVIRGFKAASDADHSTER